MFRCQTFKLIYFSSIPILQNSPNIVYTSKVEGSMIRWLDSIRHFPGWWAVYDPLIRLEDHTEWTLIFQCRIRRDPVLSLHEVALAGSDEAEISRWPGVVWHTKAEERARATCHRSSTLDCRFFAGIDAQSTVTETPSVNKIQRPQWD